MSQSEARAWWADVQYLREDFERRDAARGEGRADAAGAGASHDPSDELAARRAVREQVRERRTIEIRGHAVPAPPVPRLVEVERRRPPRRPAERVGTRPDRVAAWALVMALVLILVAVGSADAAFAAGL